MPGGGGFGMEVKEPGTGLVKEAESGGGLGDCWMSGSCSVVRKRGW